MKRKAQNSHWRARGRCGRRRAGEPGARVLALAGLASLGLLLASGGDARAQPGPETPPTPPAATPPTERAADPAADSTPPPSVRQMRLSQVLESTLARETSLEQATIDVRIADAGVLEAAGIDDWFLAANLGWSRSVSFNDQLATVCNESMVSLCEAEDIITTPVPATSTRSNYGGAFDLSRSISTGGTFTLHGDVNYTVLDTSYDTPLLVLSDVDSTRFGDNLTVGFNQPLWRGRGSHYARSGQALAEINRDAASLTREATANRVISQVISAHWEIAYAWRDLAIRRASLALAEEQLRNTQARIEVGAVAPTEALAVEQIIASREEAILNAELNVTNRSLTLRGLAGLEIGPGEIDLWSDAPVTITPRAFDTNELLARAFEQSPDLAALKVRREELAYQVELASEEIQPQLDLDASFGPTGNGEDPSEALSNTVRFRDITFGASLNLQHTFGQRTARGRAEGARERLARLEVDIRATETQITQDLVTAVKQAQIAQKRVALGDTVIGLAERNIAAEKARFDLGRATNFDVLERQDELEQAQLQRARAVVDYLLAVTTLDALTGDLLSRYGIRIDADLEPAAPSR